MFGLGKKTYMGSTQTSNPNASGYVKPTTGTNDPTFWRGTGEVSKGHHDTLKECTRNVFGGGWCPSSGRRQRREQIDTSSLDAAINMVQGMPDEPRNESMAEAFVRIKREQGWSDKKIEREARVQFHSDHQPAYLRATADAVVIEVSQILRRR